MVSLVTDPSQIRAYGYGFPLDSQGIFLLSHLTKGDFNSVLGKWMPQFPMMLSMSAPNGIFSPGFPVLNLTQALQTTASGILTTVLGQFGNALNIRSGYLNNVPSNSFFSELGHISGLAIDIGVAGFTTNPALIAKDVQQMIGGAASAINMVFDSSANDGYFHIQTNQNTILSGTGLSGPLATMNSFDMATGESVLGSIVFMNGYT